MRITNVFSPAMFKCPAVISINELSINVVKHIKLESHINNDGIAILLSRSIGEAVPSIRRPIEATPGDAFVYAQFINCTGKEIKVHLMDTEELDSLRYNIDYKFKFFIMEVK